MVLPYKSEVAFCQDNIMRAQRRYKVGRRHPLKLLRRALAHRWRWITRRPGSPGYKMLRKAQDQARQLRSTECIVVMHRRRRKESKRWNTQVLRQLDALGRMWLRGDRGWQEHLTPREYGNCLPEWINKWESSEPFYFPRRKHALDCD